MSNINFCNDVNGSYSILFDEKRPLQPYFSFVMGAYNSEKTIKKSIESILCQTFNDFELIVVDDGSIDGTHAVIKSLMSTDERIVLIHQSNIGLTKSLNRAIRVSSGEVIVRQDADDFSYPQRLELVKKMFDKGERFVVTSAYTGETESNSIKTPRKIFLIKGYLNPYSIIFGNPIVHGTFHMAASVIKNQYYDESFKYSQDYELIVRTVRAGIPIFCIDEVTYFFSKSENSISSKRKSDQIICAKNALRKNKYTDLFLIVKRGKIGIFLLKILREILLKITAISV